MRAGLIGLGIDPGDRVGIICANNWYFVASYLAVLGAGAVAVPLNPLSPARELERELAAVGARAIVVGPAGRATADAIDRDRAPGARVRDPQRGCHRRGRDLLDDLLATPPVPIVDRSADDTAVLIFTSGTAGSPKAAMLSHGNLLSNLEQVIALPRRRRRRRRGLRRAADVPHLRPQRRAGNGTPRRGHGAARRAVRPDVGHRGHPEARRHRAPRRPADVGGVGGHAGAARRFVRHRQGRHLRRRAPGPARRRDHPGPLRARGRRGLRPHRGIARGHRVDRAALAPTARWAHPSTASRSAWSTPTAKTSSSATPARSGSKARTCSRGTGTTPRPPGRASTTTAGSTPATSPLVDDDGFLFLVDRAKDLIIVSGFNVFPAEVEEVLLELDGVARVRGGRRAPPPHRRGRQGLRGGRARSRRSKRTPSSSTRPSTSPGTSARRRSTSSTSSRST